MILLDASLRLRSVRLAGLLLASMGAAAGCTTMSQPDDATVTDDGAELRQLSPAEIVGSIALGETSAAIAYTNPPRYRALAFVGTAGASVDAWVRSTDGDALGWIVTSSFKSVASNDDAHAGTTDAHLTAKLPATGTYYVVFRERDHESAHFTVTLGGTAGSVCPPGSTTTLRGKVFDPAGSVALPHATVYVPKDGDAALPPLSITDPLPIDALAQTKTNERGEFALEGVPGSGKVPVVVQRGKWRRKVMVDVPSACADNTVEDRTLRLPKNGGEGDMPHIAVTTGPVDGLECLLRGIGVDDAEFVTGADPNGHVHLFKGYGGRLGADASTELWGDVATLKRYDATLLGCEAQETLANKGGNAPHAMHAYLEEGGRVLAGHYQYVWFQSSPYPDFQQVVQWSTSGNGGSGPYAIDTSSPSGLAFSGWLESVGAATSGTIALTQVTRSVGAVSTSVQPWLQRTGGAPVLFTFDTPLAAPKGDRRGRVAFTDFHVTGRGGPDSIGACEIAAGALNPQQRALEYLVFDLTSALGE